MPASFVHLRVHTEYSLVDSVVRVPELVNGVAARGMPAVAITDQSNLFAMVKFYRGAQAAGVKPIIGADLWLDEPDDPEQPSRFTLLCRNMTGYRNLTELISRSYIDGQHRGQPRVERDWVAACSEGLIALSGAREGDVGRALLSGNESRARELLGFWRGLFPDAYYLELIRTGRSDEERYLHAAVGLAGETGTPVVATNDVVFTDPEQFEAHEARVCIQEGRTLDDPRRPKRYSPQQYLRSADEMAELFSDVPQALENTVEIARRCTVEMKLGENYLPDFPVPEGHDAASWLQKESEEGLEQRLEQLYDREDPKWAEIRNHYHERLERELGVINDMGFPGYFLIVADFIRWAKAHEIPVGPGRGSGAGSLVAYALEITDLDPLQYDLLFERFLNPERVSMPDFDVDFCMEGRDRVIEYVAERYGRDRVSQIITYGSMAARAVVRDVGRVLGHPYGFVDRIAKLIPFEVGMTLERALDEDEELSETYEKDEEVRTLVDLVMSLEGLARNAGKHAGGVVIAPSVLTAFTPLYMEPGGGNVVTQLDKDDVEEVGLVKFDFLGLRTLTIIDRAVRAINRVRERAGEAPIDIHSIPMDDAASFEMLKKCETTAVFQLESRGMKDLIRRLQPDSFEDVVALVALFRPGPLQSGMVDDFINRKHGRQKVEYPHPDLVPVLEPTYGVILYQEQVMQIAQVLAGYSLGGADILRRAMGKKKAEEMAKQREVFLEGAAERGVDENTAAYIFDLIEKFAGYGFNKSHSAAYALLSYQTAWLKAHYPAGFMASVLSADMDHTDKIVTLIDECDSIGIEVVPPDINSSLYEFSVTDDGRIRYGLGAIKGVGRSALESVLAEREGGGTFRDLADLCRRIDLQKVNRRVLEALIRAGALDPLGPNRASLMAGLPDVLQAAEQHRAASAAGQSDLFGLGPAPAEAQSTAPEPDRVPALPEWDEQDRLFAEKETLGLYLTGHPIEQFETEIAHLVDARIGDLVGEQPDPDDGERFRRPRQRNVRVAGLVMDIRKRGGRLSLTLDDRTGRLEVTLFEDQARQFAHLIAKDTIIVVDGRLGFDDFINAWRVTARDIRDLDQAREEALRGLVLRWSPEGVGDETIARLREILTPFRGGGCRIVILYRNLSAQAPVRLGADWRVRPTSELIGRLEELLGPGNVKRRFGRPEPTAPEVPSEATA